MNTERPPHTQHFRLPKCAIGTRVDGTGASFGVYASRLACVHAKVGVTKPCTSPSRYVVQITQQSLQPLVKWGSSYQLFSTEPFKQGT